MSAGTTRPLPDPIIRAPIALDGFRTGSDTASFERPALLVIPRGADAERVRTYGALMAHGVRDVLKCAVDQPGIVSTDALWLVKEAAEICAMCFHALESMEAPA